MPILFFAAGAATRILGFNERSRVFANGSAAVSWTNSLPIELLLELVVAALQWRHRDERSPGHAATSRSR